MVIIDPVKCSGLRSCIDACPYDGVISFNPVAMSISEVHSLFPYSGQGMADYRAQVRESLHRV